MDLQDFHARRLGEIMAAAGYGEDDIGRVGALVRKEQLKSDAEAQTLEDVACLVFLAHYLHDFVAKTDPDKLAGILAKTWNKMSPSGRDAALKLALPSAIPGLLTFLPLRNGLCVTFLTSRARGLHQHPPSNEPRSQLMQIASSPGRPFRVRRGPEDFKSRQALSHHTPHGKPTAKSDQVGYLIGLELASETVARPQDFGREFSQMARSP
jgi:hypothetical protein